MRFKYKDVFPQNALRLLKSCIDSKNTYLKKESIIILVCGAESNESNNSYRNTLTKYCQKHLKEYRFFYAEKVFDTLYKRKDLLSLEEELIEFTDCIIIILESPGSLSEIGAFTITTKIIKILLIINDIKYKNSKSFINLGPIAKANKESIFKPAIFIDLEKISNNISIIEERLKSKLRKNRKNIDLKSLKNLDSKIKMLFFADIISFFSPLTKKELISILQYLYGYNKRFNIDMELGILETLEEIAINNGYYCSTLYDREFFLDYPFDKIQLRSEIVNHYSKNYKERSRILVDRAIN